MHSWTDQPQLEIWNHFRYLSAPANIKGILTGQIPSGRDTLWQPSNDLNERAIEISCCIKQADEYFRAAQTVGLMTKPLLLFYGVQSLAKSAILANNRSLRLSDIKYHGLYTRFGRVVEPLRSQLESYVNNPSSWSLEDEFSVTNDGVFSYFAETVGDPKPSNHRVVRFKELLAIVPDMSRLFFRHYQEPSQACYLYGKPKINTDGSHQIHFLKLGIYDKSILKNIFPEFGTGYDYIESASQPGFKSHSKDHQLPVNWRIGKGCVAGDYLIRPHHIGIASPLSTLYALSFILSMIVRYKQPFWIDIIEGRTSGSSALAGAICNLLERDYPNRILEVIWDEDFTYGSKTWLS